MWSLMRVVSEGFFGMPQEINDWPSLDLVMQKNSAAEPLLTWLRGAFKAGDSGLLEIDVGGLLDLLTIEVDAYGLKELVNLAMNRKNAWHELSAKTPGMKAMVGNQGNMMMQNLRERHSKGQMQQSDYEQKCRTVPLWQSKKEADMDDHLRVSEGASRAAVCSAAGELLEIFAKVTGSQAPAPVDNGGDVEMQDALADPTLDAGVLSELESGVWKMQVDEQARTRNA